MKDGTFTVKGTDKSKAWGESRLAAYVPHNYPLATLEPGLEETAFYDPANFTFPAGAYACEVEVDPDTGRVDDLRVRGGRRFRQHRQPDDRRRPGPGRDRPGHRPGAAGALRSTTTDGQLLSGRFMDYAMPRAEDLPFFASTIPA